MLRKTGLRIKTPSMVIYIEENILLEISKYQKQRQFKLESGGIIIGYYDSLEKALRITDITWPQIDDIRGRYRFIRKETGHQEIMDRLWEQSGYKKSYLGEWHTHNQRRPIPSLIDCNNWKNISKRQHNFNQQFFIIIGTMCSGIWMTEDGKIQKIGEWDNNGTIM